MYKEHQVFLILLQLIHYLIILIFLIHLKDSQIDSAASSYDLIKVLVGAEVVVQSAPVIISTLSLMLAGTPPS